MLAFYVQILRVSYDKAARGGSLAKRRAALPNRIARLAEFQPQTLTVETLDLNSENNFVAPLSRIEKFDLCAGLKHEMFFFDGEKAHFILRRENLGAPSVFWKTKQFEIPVHGWFQASWNGRFSDFDSGIWTYEQKIFNAAAFLGSQKLFSDEPSLQFSRMARLW